MFVPAVAAYPLCSLGLLSVEFEGRVNKLWVERGGRLDDELEYIGQHNGTRAGEASRDQILITVDQRGVLNEMVLDEHLWLLKLAYNSIEVSLAPPLAHPNCAHLPEEAGDAGYSAKQHQLCDRIEAPEEYAVFTPSLPCTRVTPLDCFEEGNYDAAGEPPLLSFARFLAR
eukprot:COSAG05_NODE_2588_length_2868_cov_8.486096_2_plen_171_part_00